MVNSKNSVIAKDLLDEEFNKYCLHTAEIRAGRRHFSAGYKKVEHKSLANTKPISHEDSTDTY